MIPNGASSPPRRRGAGPPSLLLHAKLCRRSGGLTDFLFPLSTAEYTDEATEEAKLNIAIDSPVDLKNIYSPTARGGRSSGTGKRQQHLREVLRPRKPSPPDVPPSSSTCGDQQIAAGAPSKLPLEKRRARGYFLLRPRRRSQSNGRR